MQILIRFVTRNAAGGTEHNDRLVESSTITIGRATDQTLHLRDKRVRLQHAKIEVQAGQALITTSAPSGIAVNGRTQSEAQLRAGDIVEIGSNILRVIEPEDGVDFAMTFELSDAASVEHRTSDWSDAASGIGGWSKRRLSWAVALLVLLGAAILPAFKLISPNVLQAGPIHSAHAPTAGECSACHLEPFERVPDSACVECHTVDRHVVATEDTVLGTTRCASCHLEHNEPQQLVNQHQGLCTDCHTDATDFLTGHPEFEPQQSPENTASNLRFDHSVHLDTAGVVTPDGRRVLECTECHIEDPGGARMQPISMVEHCSGCHTLAFDPDDPSRVVPHGDPKAVVQSLIEYYSARLLGADPEAATQRVRRPGQSLSRADRDRVAAEARVRALAVAGDLFERRACATCHEISSDPANRVMPWQVAPVTLADEFLPHANFSHAAHQTEISSCDNCHNASTSTAATDLLIPDLDSCRECHGSGIARLNAAHRTPSTCVMCHSFHFDSKGSQP